MWCHEKQSPTHSSWIWFYRSLKVAVRFLFHLQWTLNEMIIFFQLKMMNYIDWFQMWNWCCSSKVNPIDTVYCPIYFWTWFSNTPLNLSAYYFISFIIFCKHLVFNVQKCQHRKLSQMSVLLCLYFLSLQKVFVWCIC